MNYLANLTLRGYANNPSTAPYGDRHMGSLHYYKVTILKCRSLFRRRNGFEILFYDVRRKSLAINNLRTIEAMLFSSFQDAGAHCIPSFLQFILIILWIFSKLIYSFIFPIGCVCCWSFVTILSKIQVQVLLGGFGSSIPIFVVSMPIWTSWLWLDRIMFWFLLSLGVSDRRHLSELSIPGFGCPQQRLRNYTPSPGYGSLC